MERITEENFREKIVEICEPAIEKMWAELDQSNLEAVDGFLAKLDLFTARLLPYSQPSDTIQMNENKLVSDRILKPFWAAHPEWAELARSVARTELAEVMGW